MPIFSYGPGNSSMCGSRSTRSRRRWWCRPRRCSAARSGTFSYVIGDGDIVTAKPVVVTQQNETDAVIASGLSPSDRVVTTGFANLSDGAKVIIGKDEQTPTADLAPRKKGSRGPQGNGQGKDGEGRRPRQEGRGRRRSQGGPAPGGEPSGSGAKSQP